LVHNAAAFLNQHEVQKKVVVKFLYFFMFYWLIVRRGHIQKIRPLRDDLDAAVSSQKVVLISGQSRITLLNKYQNSIKWSKFSMMVFVVDQQLNVL
jgi:hypothetical protein